MTGLVSCASCGMQFSLAAGRCPKCDTPAFSENRRATLTVDIAHQGQHLEEALHEFDAALQMAKEQNYGYLRLVVGSGKINRELARDLEAARWQGRIREFEHEPGNMGAYLVRL